MIPVPLGIKPEEIPLGAYASQSLDEDVADATVRKYRVVGGNILVTIWHGHVHKVIYQTPLPFFWLRWRRNRDLLKYYGEGQKWAEDWPVDFGKSRKRADGQVRSLYSRIMDYMTFLSVEYNDHRKEARWGNSAS